MEYTKLGNSELNVSKVCLGTMTYGDQNTETEAHEQLDYATSLGINSVSYTHLDAAFCNAERVTLVGSKIPISIISPYVSLAAL